MKKLGAILLLLILLFNTTGYRFLISYLEALSDRALECDLNHNHYNERDLVTVKVSLQLPYQTNWSDFERVDGKVEFDGKTYKYVKQKICDGQLILMCLPDEQTQHLEAAKNDFFKLANDLADTPSGKTPANSTGFAKAQFSIYDVNGEPWRCITVTQAHAYLPPCNHVLKTFCMLLTPEQPPDTLFS